MKQKLALVILSLSLSSLCKAASWEMKSEIKDIPKTEVTLTEVTFSSGKETIKFTPSQDPYGMVFDKKMTFEGKDYFITGWAQGAATMLFRVFLPETHKGKPLCEVTSFAEEAELRMVKGKIEISIVESSEGKQTWTACSKK